MLVELLPVVTRKKFADVVHSALLIARLSPPRLEHALEAALLAIGALRSTCIDRE